MEIKIPKNIHHPLVMEIIIIIITIDLIITAIISIKVVVIIFTNK